MALFPVWRQTTLLRVLAAFWLLQRKSQGGAKTRAGACVLTDDDTCLKGTIRIRPPSKTLYPSLAVATPIATLSRRRWKEKCEKECEQKCGKGVSSLRNTGLLHHHGRAA
ncbi:unnamed protein product [Amoebophrya sp. A120]|nr:unnamed protein product [Amoebophrya sp. A120]|eukprot:GSA120T00007941001.1